jgi:hypothetical protein
LSASVTPSASNTAGVVATAGATDASHPSIFDVAIDPVIVGACVSTTVITCVNTALTFPQSSVAVQVFV